MPARRRTTTRLRTQIGLAIGDAARSVIEVADGAGVSWPTAHAASVAHAEAVLSDPAPVRVLGIDETHRGKPSWTRDQASGRWVRTDPWDTGFVDLAGDQGLVGQVEGRTGPAGPTRRVAAARCSVGWPVTTTSDGTPDTGIPAPRPTKGPRNRLRCPQPPNHKSRVYYMGARPSALRALLTARRGVVKARTAAINQIKSLLITAPAELRERYRRHTTTTLIRALARCRPLPTTTPPSWPCSSAVRPWRNVSCSSKTKTAS